MSYQILHLSFPRRGKLQEGISSYVSGRGGSTSRSYGSCAGEVHIVTGVRSGTSTTPTQLLETTPLVASCASEHSSASPVSGDLPAARASTAGIYLSQV